jgi:hypothetical protein
MPACTNLVTAMGSSETLGFKFVDGVRAKLDDTTLFRLGQVNCLSGIVSKTKENEKKPKKYFVQTGPHFLRNPTFHSTACSFK